MALCFFGVFPWLLIDLPEEIARPHLAGRDFDCLWVAARMVLEGHVSDVFKVDAFQATFKHLLAAEETHQIYSYPPHGLFLAVPFGLLPYGAALILWNVATLAIFLWAARPFLSKQLPWWVVAISPATIICFGFGHYGLLVSALFLLSFRGSGISAAAMTFKPHMGVLVAVQMLRDRKALPYAIGGTLLLVALSLVAFGWQPWVDFFSISLPRQFGRVSNVDATFLRMHVTPAAGYGAIGQVLCAGMAIFLLTRSFNVFTAATATFLIVPYGFHYDMAGASLGFAYLIANRFEELPRWQRLVLALGFCTPGLAAIGTWFAPPVLLLGLCVQTEMFRRQALEPAAPGSNPLPALKQWARTGGVRAAFRRRIRMAP